MTIPIQRNFAGGAISPDLAARSDTTKYATGLRRCDNFTIQKHGGVQNRAGFSFVQETKHTDKRSVLLKFVFNAEQTYLIEAGDKYLRLFRDGAPLLAVNPPLFASGLAYPPGVIVLSGGLYFWRTPVNPNLPTVSTTGAEWYAMTNGAQVEVPTPYTEADLRGLRTAQTADTLTIVHPGYTPYDLVRVGSIQWTFSPVSIKPGVATPLSVTVSGGSPTTSGSNVWGVTAVNTTTGEESFARISAPASVFGSPTIPVTVTFSLVPGADAYYIYREVGGAFGDIGRSNGSAFKDIGQVPALTVRPPAERITFTSSGDFPSAVAYYQGRRYFAGTSLKPAGVYGSRIGLPNNFTVSSPVLDGDAVTFSLLGSQVHRIRALIGVGRLIILTSGGEWVVSGDASGAITPSRVNAQQMSYVGSAPVNPAVVDRQVAYTQYHGSIVHGLSLEDGNSLSDDKTIYARHFFEGSKLVNMAFSQVPDSILWVLSSTGTLLGLTIVPGQDVSGWHKHTTDGLFEDIIVLPTGDYIGFGGVEGIAPIPHDPPPVVNPPEPPPPFTTGAIVSGAVSGVTLPGLVLSNAAIDQATVNTNGAFTFVLPKVVGEAYNVSVLQQPVGHTCQVSGGVGVSTGANVTTVTVTCIAAPPPVWFVSGTLPVNVRAYALVAVGSTFVAVGVSTVTGNGAALRSVDNGVTWTAVSTTISGTKLSATHNGVRIVAVGYGAVMTSDDVGLTWVSRVTPVLPVSDNWSAVTYAGTTLLAVSLGATSMRSLDNGVTWSTVVLPQSADWKGIKWDGTVAVAAGSTSTTGVVATTTDGLVWTPQTLPVGVLRINALEVIGTTFVASIERYAAGSSGPTIASVMTSINGGVTWSISAYNIETLLYSLASNGTRLVGVGRSLLGRYASSDDSGSNWVVKLGQGDATFWNAAAWNGTRYAALGISPLGLQVAMTSLTG